MIWPLAAVCAVVALGVRGPDLLRRASRSCGPGPRTMLALWTLATAVWSASCAALAAVFAAELLGPSVKAVLAACLSVLQALERDNAGWGVGVSAALVLAAALRLLWTGARRGRAGSSWRRSHHRDLLSRARRRLLHGQRVWLVDSAESGAYCVPGAQGGVVITRGALEVLSGPQVRAVLAHEKAHLSQRHHLVVGWVRLLDSAFPRVPLFRAAASEVPVLVEWAADDRAVREVGVRPLVHALGALAEAGRSRSPQVLSIDGARPVDRVRRQVAPLAGCRRWRTRARTALVAALVSAPLLITVASALAGVLLPYCDCAAY
ncbi:M56 family metallopeptidase [Nocardiopsis dassonvillei]|uniref:M56 family metallopeptidase n=1 Tax=Nocardiopsis dassonvillei TaxID=2014 RepID=UPI0033F4F22F